MTELSFSVQGQQVEDLMMALFLGQDSARYELSLKIEMEEGAFS